MAPGLEWSRTSSSSQPWPWQKEACVDIFDTDLTNTSLLATYRHALTSGLYPAHFWAYARTRTPAHVFPAHITRTHVPTPRRFLSKPSAAFYVSSGCYFSVFSSVCIKRSVCNQVACNYFFNRKCANQRAIVQQENEIHRVTGLVVGRREGWWGSLLQSFSPLSLSFWSCFFFPVFSVVSSIL